MRFYELQYFYSRKESGSLYVKINVCKDDFCDEDIFLDLLVSRCIISYEEAQHVFNIVEISEEEYKHFCE